MMKDPKSWKCGRLRWVEDPVGGKRGGERGKPEKGVTQGGYLTHPLAQRKKRDRGGGTQGDGYGVEGGGWDSSLPNEILETRKVRGDKLKSGRNKGRRSHAIFKMGKRGRRGGDPKKYHRRE